MKTPSQESKPKHKSKKNNNENPIEDHSPTSTNDKNSTNDNNSEGEKKIQKPKAETSKNYIKLNQNAEQISQTESRAKPYKRERFLKNEYKNRSSLLDDCLEDSYVNKSGFIGFVNLGKLVAIMFIITTPIVSISSSSCRKMLKKDKIL